MPTQSRSIPRRTAPLLLPAAALRSLLEPAALLAAIERSLLALDRGTIVLAPTTHLPGDAGGFHLKSAFSTAPPRRAVTKINGNFPANSERFGLPTIQGVVALLDLESGSLLALADSPTVTALRTAAVSALAARRLARPGASTLALVGCGVQGHEHLALLAPLFPLRSVRLFDRDPRASECLAGRASGLGLTAEVVSNPAEATRGAEIVVTSTSATAPLLFDADVAAGAFVAAVGADNPDKQELAPDLLAGSIVVVDALASAAANGDLRSALASAAMTLEQVHGELPALLAGRIAGRSHADERFVFDSTGLAATDLATMELAWERAIGEPRMPRFAFAAESTPYFPTHSIRSSG